MPLAPETRLGSYRVVSPLGAGGMGEVYRATDPKLGRDVAIKLLPGAFAALPDRLARFEREAKLLASLNHPNIAHVYGFESATLADSSTAHFLVMELVPGEDLAERLKRGAIPVDEALEIAKQVAYALEEAHESGIVHRDLKPANVKTTPDGKVKVLDFGLAKAYAGGAAAGSSADLSQSPTLAHTGTQAGVILGTAAYMSPEQARGKPVDKRADIWAFGVVLYEMLTGRKLFTGETMSDVLAGVLKTEVDLAFLPGSTPPAVRQLLRRCLERNPKNRLHDIADARIAIDEAMAGVDDPPATPGSAVAASAPAAAPWPTRLTIAVLSLATLGLAARLLSIPRPESPVAVRFAFSAAPAQDLGTTPGRSLALSPDGTTLVYSTADSGGTRLFKRTIDDLQQLPIAGTEGAANPFFSYDGREIGFVVGNQLKKLPIGGATATVVADIDGFRGASWGPDGIVVSAGGNLALVPGEGGAAVSLAGDDSVRGFWPVVLPGGKAVVYSTFGIADGPIGAARLANGRVARPTRLAVSGNVPLGVVGGHLVFARSNGQMFAAPFDADQLRVTGSARAIESEVARNSGNGETKAAVSGNGTLAYARGSGLVQVAVADLGGVVRALPVPPGRLHFPRFSPDGRKFAADLSSDGRTDAYVYDVESGAVQRLTADGTVNERPEWSRDGRRILYKADRAGAHATLWWQPADGGGAAEPLVASAGRDIWQGVLSPDGKTVLYRSGGGGSGDIWYAPVGGGSDGTAFAATRFNELGPRFSPDGRWVAYYSNEARGYQVYVRPFPGPGAAVPVSVSGGEVPVWSPDGRKIFFVAGRQLIAASVVTTPSFSVTGREVLFERDFVAGGGHAAYDVSPDGKSFLLLIPVALETEKIVVVRNWAAELRAGAAKEATP